MRFVSGDQGLKCTELYSREMSVGADHKIRFAVLVDYFGRSLQPNPAEVLGL